MARTRGFFYVLNIVIMIYSCILCIHKNNTRYIHVEVNKDKVLNVRADANLIEAFKHAASNNDRTVSQLIRDFMREYVKKHGQTDLFGKK